MKTARRWRSPSLFWTFAGSFLLVLLAASILQGWVVVELAERWAIQSAEERASDALNQASWQLLSLAPPLRPHEVEDLLRRSRPPDLPLFLVYHQAANPLISDRQLSLPMRLQLRALLGLEGRPPVPPHLRFEDPRRRGPAGPRPKPPRRRGPEGPRQGSRPGPGPELRVPATRPGPPPEKEIHLLGRRHLDSTDPSRGEIAAFLDAGGRRSGLLSEAGPTLFFVPLAVLLAGAAGLILFRAFLGRLKALERLMARIEGGDLDARVADLGPDEIGRLGVRLNRMTESLARARDQLAEVELQRRRLLADVSHELATPLTSIRGYAETLLDPAVPVSPEERAAYLQHVLEESKRMDLLIQDLFELTRLEAEGADLEPERLDAAELCRNTVSRFSDLFEMASLNLEWHGPEEPVWIEADGRRLEQVVDNLLANALRYVPSGGTVEVELSASAASGDVRLEIRDDGNGVPEGELPRIFERFYRAKTARATAGTGLGLAIVKEIVHQHGGLIAAMNLQPRGLGFAITLPAAPAA